MKFVSEGKRLEVSDRSLATEGRRLNFAFEDTSELSNRRRMSELIDRRKASKLSYRSKSTELSD